MLIGKIFTSTHIHPSFAQGLIKFAKDQLGVTRVRRLRAFLDRNRIPEAVDALNNANVEIVHVETSNVVLSILF